MSVSAEVLAARTRAARLYPRSAALQGAYVAGARAAERGSTTATCPYRRSAGGWSAGFRKAWLSGWGSVSFDADA